MNKFKNPFAINENKKIIYIKNGDVKNREEYKKCYCPICGEKLIPRMGKKNVWHFSHSNNKNCNGNFETSLHLYAKEVIKNNNTILLPNLSIYEYVNFNKMEKSFIKDLHKWEYENQERIMNQSFLNKNVCNYNWMENEIKIDDFVPDCIVGIDGKKMAIEIFVTHPVDKIKEKKVKKANIDMIEIDLSDIVEQMNKQDFDLEKHILFKAARWWIYKTRMKKEEDKLYNKIYNTKRYILNEEYTKDDLIEIRNLESRKKEYEEKLKRQRKQEKEKKVKYAIEHKKEYERNKAIRIIRIIENYSFKKQNEEVYVCNIPVKGEYVFDCSREFWQKKIYDTFILKRDGKIIQLAKIVSWVEKYSGLKFFKEFDYSKDKIWNSIYDTVRNYLIELEKLDVIKTLGYNITKWGEIKVINSDKIEANLIIKNENILVCKNCGEIYNDEDLVNKFYINNFELDKNCFEEIIKEYYNA